MEKLRVGVVTFSHPMVYPTDRQREAFVRSEYDKLCSLLIDNGFEVIGVMQGIKTSESPRFGICTNSEADLAANFLNAAKAECLVIGLNQWTNPHMAVTLIKQAGLPSCMYTSGGIDYPGETTAAAIYASMTESSETPRQCLMTERFREWNYQEMIPWIKGASAVVRLRKSRILAWGGTYGANIPYTRDDDALLEDKLVREIIYESEEYISSGAKTIVEKQPKRIHAFRAWLEQNGVTIQFDEKMLTPSVLDLQIGQYLAAKDRLDHYRDNGIVSVTVKCHFDVSTDCLGCTECLIPAFLPYHEDHEGEKQIVPVSCEGDIKAAVTSAILLTLNPDSPPLFGDVIVHTDEHMTVSNCGASSVYWAGRDLNSRANLSNVKICPQLHGRSGGAVRYLAVSGTITAARLFRCKGTYFMYMGVGKVHEQRDFTQTIHGTNWPQTLITFGTNHYDIFRTIPSNHIVLTEGDISLELEHFCRYQGIQVIRCDQEDSLKAFRKLLAYGL